MEKITTGVSYTTSAVGTGYWLLQLLDKVSPSQWVAGVSYTTSAVGTGYWLLQLLDKVSPSQWVAIGVLGSLLFGLLTYLTNLYFKIREDRRKAARGE
ncbi:class II holin family protein [Escherichia coli]|nr:class II holin family protein [Escherichia coli]MCC8228221.1 class II holin family protein [Escherichia coli]